MGGVTYLRNLIRALLEIESDHSYIVFATEENRERLVPEDHERLHVLEVNLRWRFFRLLYEQLVLPVRLALVRADVLFAPTGIAPLLSQCPVVLALPGLNIAMRGTIRRSPPDRLRNGILFLLAWFSARKAAERVFLSRISQSMISRALGIDPKRGVILHLGVDPLFRNASPHESSGGTKDDPAPVLCVSAVVPRKNLGCLIEAYGNLPDQLQASHPLVIVGPIPNRRYYDSLASRLCAIEADPRDVFAGILPQDALAVLYRQAAVLVHPSLLETFGLPLVEAMASGVPVIAADAPSAPEIVGDAAELFDPHSPSALRASIEALLNDEQKRASLISKGYQRAEPFTWGKAAARMIEVFSTVAEANRTKRRSRG